MAQTLLTGDLSFKENPLFEKIIQDLLKQNYSVCDNFFELQLIANLRDRLKILHNHSELKKAAIGNKVNESISKAIRGDYIQWIDERLANPEERLFFEAINTFKTYLNMTCFMGILHQEFHYAVYPKGTFYKRHLDTFQNDDRRKLSMVCYLNDDSWDKTNGGELVIYPENSNEVIIHPLLGRVVIFESQLLEHEVRPVFNDMRLSITGWLKTR
jgi:SM-20-related protein